MPMYIYPRREYVFSFERWLGRGAACLAAAAAGRRRPAVGRQRKIEMTVFGDRARPCANASRRRLNHSQNSTECSRDAEVRTVISLLAPSEPVSEPAPNDSILIRASRSGLSSVSDRVSSLRFAHDRECSEIPRAATRAFELFRSSLVSGRSSPTHSVSTKLRNFQRVRRNGAGSGASASEALALRALGLRARRCAAAARLARSPACVETLSSHPPLAGAAKAEKKEQTHELVSHTLQKKEKTTPSKRRRSPQARGS